MAHVSDTAYLRRRVAQAFDAGSQHTPRWTITDARAVRAVLDRLDRLERRSRITPQLSTSGDKPVDALLASPRGPFDMVEAE